MTKQRRVTVYVDGANIFYTQKKLGWSIDWTKLEKLIIKQGQTTIYWRYYTGLKNGDEKMEKYLNHLKRIGFFVITKPLKKIKLERRQEISNQSELDFIYKANFDVEIAVDTLLNKSLSSTIILFSGDSDFAYLVKRLRLLGKSVLIYSSRKTISWELKLAASKVFYLEDLKEKISKK